MKCLNCNKKLNQGPNCSGKYCSNACSGQHKKKVSISEWLDGKRKGYTGKTLKLKPFVRDFLFKTRGTQCSVCGWDKKHPNDNLPLTEIDHIDGDAKNCVPSNLRILCPNCHSMTPTFKRRNLNSERIR